MNAQSDKKVLASPNNMLWRFYASLNRQVNSANQAKGDAERKQNVAVCIILAITLIEAFLNIFFRVVVSEKEFSQFSQQILDDLDRRASLEYKIREWPKLVFGKSIDFRNGIGKDFVALKDARNWLMHFTSTYETIVVDNMTIHGLADISRYEALGDEDAARALHTAQGTIAEIIRLRGIPRQDIPYHLQSWLGKILV